MMEYKDIFLWVIITVLCFIIIERCLNTSTSNKKIKNINKVGNSINEPFTRKFFQQKAKNYTLALENIKSNNYDFSIKLSKYTPFIMEIIQIVNNKEKYESLNNNDIQFIFSDTNTVYRMFNEGLSQKTIRERIQKRTGTTDTTVYNPSVIKYPNIRFVCAFYDTYITAVTFSLQTFEFQHLKESYLRVNIGEKNTNIYFTSLILLEYYGLRIIKDGVSPEEAKKKDLGDIYISYYSNADLIDHYGSAIPGFTSMLNAEDIDDKSPLEPDSIPPYVDVALLMTTHPDETVYKLTNKRLSRFMNFSRLNNGDITTITTDEIPFYNEYPFYHKAQISKTLMLNYYPKVDMFDFVYLDGYKTYDSDRLNLFVNTIALKYNLLSNDKTDPTLITSMLIDFSNHLPYLNKGDYIWDKLTTNDMDNYTLDVPQVHNGARNFFYKAGLYTTIDNENCRYIDGKCTLDKLYNKGFLIEDIQPPPEEISTAEQIIAWGGLYSPITNKRIPVPKQKPILSLKHN